MIKIALLFLSISLINGFPLSGDIVIKPGANDSVQTMLDDAKDYFKIGEEEKALDVYLDILKKEPENYEALWNTSFIYTRKGRRQTDFSSMEFYYRSALDIAAFCLEKHPDKPRSHYVFAVASAGLADKIPNSSERVGHIWNMKEHSYRAAELDPDYAPAWHLKGVWHSKLANISRTQRFAARFVYGSLPGGASNDKAEEYMKHAISLDPDVIVFKLDLAQHYQETGQPNKALPILESILIMEPVSLNDHIDFKEARERHDTVN